MVPRKEKTEKRKGSRLLWVLLLLALLTVSAGGVRAYLLHSGDAVTNEFQVESDPKISINSTYEVTVSNTAYPVYLRAAVVVNWKDTEGHILATVPTGYTLTPSKDAKTGAAWVKHTDGFYYYTKSVITGEDIPPVITLSPPSVEQEGYTLVADVAVQAIQAIGTTDGAAPVDAVKDAWGISGAEITALTP